MRQLGVLVPIVTPCDRSGALAVEGLRSVCKDMLDNGCHAIFVAGSSGRGPWFSRTEKVKACQVVADQIGSKIPLFAGCMASGVQEMLENTRAMAGAGAHFTVLTAPGYFSYSQSEVEAIFLRFIDNSPLPVMVYDIPVFAGMKLDTRMIARLATHENVIGFKDSSADLERFKLLLDALRDRSDFYLVQGKEHLLADSIVAGASGLVCSLIHVNPRPFVAVYTACRSGDMVLAQKLQTGITRVYAIVNGCFERRPETSTLFHFMNHALKKRGLCENILLEHEGECPSWIAEEVEKALDCLEDQESRADRSRRKQR